MRTEIIKEKKYGTQNNGFINFLELKIYRKPAKWLLNDKSVEKNGKCLQFCLVQFCLENFV